MSMNKSRGLHHITAQALVPEQILPYVAAVGASKPVLFAQCVGHVYEDSLVLVAYPPASDSYFSADAATHSPPPYNTAHCHNVTSPSNTTPPVITPKGPTATSGPLSALTNTTAPVNHTSILHQVDAAVSAACQTQAYTTITVLAPVRPSAAPADADSTQDMFWSIPLPPPPPQQKLRNMLRRAHRDITLDTGTEWTAAHAALAHAYCQSRPLAAGTRHIFQHLGDYVRTSPDALVFSAYSRTDNSLLACALGEFSSMTTALYMFAFRLPTAPPGTSDALLEALCAAGQTRGHCQLNLGLGINAGISFFKHKWQARPFMPYVECSWQLKKKSLWNRLFG